MVVVRDLTTTRTHSPQEAVTDMAAPPLPKAPGVACVSRGDDCDAEGLDPVAVDERVGHSVLAQGELGQVHEGEEQTAGPGSDLEAGAADERDTDAEQAGHEQPVRPRAGDVVEEGS